MPATASVQIEGNDYIVEKGNCRTRCHDLDTLKIVLVHEGWPAEKAQFLVWNLGGALLNPAKAPPQDPSTNN